MKIISETSIEDFKAWSGAKDTLNRVIAEDKCEELESMLEEMYPDGMTDTELNDLLWFEPDTIYEWLGIPTEKQIRTEIEEIKEKIDELLQSYEDDISEKIDEINSNREIEGMNELCKKEIESLKTEVWHIDYKYDIDGLEERISELEEELENI